MARIVTGSVADAVPWAVSNFWVYADGVHAHTHPTPTADINVPKNAKANIDPKFQRKVSWTVDELKPIGRGREAGELKQVRPGWTNLLQLTIGVEADRRKERIEE